MKQMDNKKRRSTGYWLLLPAIGFGAVGMAAYMKYGITEFTPSLSQSAVAAFGLGIILCIFSLIREYKVIKFLGYLSFLYAWIESLLAQATYIANVFVSIDGNSFSAGFLTTVICSLAGAVFALFSVILDKRSEQAANAGQAIREDQEERKAI